MEELKTSPGGEVTNAAEMAAKALDLELNAGSLKAGGGDPSKATVVNDLNTMVRKKKKPAATPNGDATEANGKRKAEEEVASDSKKVKVEDATMATGVDASS